MSNGWSLFIIIGTLGSLVGTLWLLAANRSQPGPEPGTTGHVFDGIEELENPLPRWWLSMFVGTIVFAVGYLIYYPGLGSFAGIAGWSSQSQWAEDVRAREARFAPLYAEIAGVPLDELLSDRQAQQIGRRLYLNNCSTCHGLTAQGAFGFPDLTDQQWLWGDTFDAIKTSIQHGRTGAMAAWGPALGDSGVVEVSHYVAGLAGGEHDAGLATLGETHFATFCVACHGPEGTGNQVLGAPDLTNGIWLYGGTPDQIAFTVRHGRNGIMPPHLDLLGEDRTHILAAYIASLRAPGD